MEKEDEVDLSVLHQKLIEEGIEHSYEQHPAAVREPDAAAILGRKYHPVGSHQIRIKEGNISIIRGMASFGLFELYGGRFDCDRFDIEEDVIEALKGKEL